MNLRISVTALDSFRLFKESEWFDLDKLIDQLTSKTEATLQMSFGTAYHGIIEHRGIPVLRGDYQKTDFDFLPIIDRAKEPEILSEGWFIPYNLARPALDWNFKHHEFGEPEIKIVKEYQYKQHSINVVGKTDKLEGLIAYEHKTTPNVDFDKYIKSYQWRFYTQLFEVSRVEYNVFELDLISPTKFKAATTQDEFIAQIQNISLHNFVFEAYDNIESDCANLVYEFVEFLENKNLINYFIQN